MSSLFATLPVELHHEIASYSNIDCLSRLSQISKTFHEHYNPVLYQNVNGAALPTLGIPQEDRFPLTGPHPATFLRSMRIVGRKRCEPKHHSNVAQQKVEDQIVADRLETQISAAMVNICKYTSKDSLRSFSFIHPSARFLEVFTTNSVCALSSLESLAIACCFPQESAVEHIIVFPRLVRSWLPHASSVMFTSLRLFVEVVMWSFLDKTGAGGGDE